MYGIWDRKILFKRSFSRSEPDCDSRVAGKRWVSGIVSGLFEEAVENTPARIIETHTHGVGIQYRNAFRNTQIDWEEYDRLFEIGRHNMEPEEAVYASAYRLKSPLGLKEEAAQSYENF